MDSRVWGHEGMRQQGFFVVWLYAFLPSTVPVVATAHSPSQLPHEAVGIYST